MCQMSMKLPAMFDQNPPHTIDKIVKKSLKKHATCEKNLAGGPLVTATDQRSRMTRLIIITARRFLASKN